MNKKAIVLTVCMALVFTCLACLVGCQSAKPSDTVKSTLDDVSKNGITAISNNFKSRDLATNDMVSSLSKDASDTLTDEQKKVWDDYAKMITGYDYKIEQEVIDGDKATVDVSFTTYSCGKILEDSISSYMQKAFMAALSNWGSNTSSTNYNEILYKEIQSNMDAMSTKTYSKKGSVNLNKQDGKWVISDVSDDFVDGLTGGFITSAKNLSESFSSLSGK